ncbi:MAG TPA: DUF2971 domain-containing protein [Trebonia sp.]|jgi:hypothetical protein|nr:DUF2971 domain-containing protein [Trebonia sp.]
MSVTPAILSVNLTNDLYHYTSAEVAIYNILDQGALRLSPYEFTNDPEESRPRLPTLSGEIEKEADDAPGSIWAEADWWLRRYVKVACLTQDFEILPVNYADDPDALRGWAHPALWAHYGARHGGVCLRFDRNKLIEQFEGQMKSRGQCFHGAVEYPFQRFTAPPGSLYYDQVREFGVDAVVSFYIDKYHKELFFFKHHDWANEREFRLLLNEPSLMPAYLDIRDSLTGIVLGENFPASMLDRLHHLRSSFRDLEIFRLLYHNGKMFRAEVPVATDRGQIRTRRHGPLATRLEELRTLEEQRKQAQASGAIITAEIFNRLTVGISAIQEVCSTWPNSEVGVYQRNRAIPPEQYGKRPGVPGEVVEFQIGSMCVVENLPKQSWTLIIALAIQLLDTKVIRLHGMIELVKSTLTGSEPAELWRTSYETTIVDACGKMDLLIEEIQSQMEESKDLVDASRSQ